MFRILKATKDCYITDRVINGTRVTDANVGYAGTLDLFKLYNEVRLSGSTNPIELSRVLIKFDLDPLRAMTGSVFNPSHASFSAKLKLIDIIGGQSTPTNFKLVLFPLSKSFDEGIGRDIVRFSDLDSCNFITASVESGNVSAWVLSGANAKGTLGASNIDVISSGTLDADVGNIALFVEQTFAAGDEDIEMDVTQIVSATLAGIIPDHGFRISYAETFETGSQTLFVKRFSSRHSTNTRIRPKIEIKFDDTIIDHHSSFFFDTSGSLFLNNSVRGTYSHILSGTSLVPVTGANCLLLSVTSGAYSQTVTASQHAIGGLYLTGVYSASFSINSLATASLVTEIALANSATFTTIWKSLDGTLGFHTGSLVVNKITRSSFNSDETDATISLQNLKSTYQSDETALIRVFAEDRQRVYIPRRLPIENTGIVFEKVYFQIRDFNSNDILLPFDVIGTRASVDSRGMYFKLYMDDLDAGRVYVIDLKIIENGIERIFVNEKMKFRIDP